MASSKKQQEFIDYVWSFYAPDSELYGDFFDKTLTKEEIKKALKMRLTNKKLAFDGDSFDREIVRDIMFYNRGKKDGLEHNIKSFVKQAS